MVQFFQNLVGTIMQFEQSGSQHVASRSHTEVKIDSFHGATRFLFQMVDYTGHVTGAKAVVDVYDGDAAGTGIQHAEQGCNAAE